MMVTVDEYQGVGGAYIYDPKTGTRKPAPAVKSEPASPKTPSPEVTTNAAPNEKAPDSVQD